MNEDPWIMTNDPRIKAAALAVHAYETRKYSIDIDDAENIARAALAAADAAAWRPISEAPSGDHSVIVDMWANGERYTDCRWGRPTYGGQKGVYGWVYQSGYDCDGPVDDWVPSPTHFMHIPKASQEQE